MKPTPKAPAIAALLSAMCGTDHNATIEADTCKICGSKADEFKTDLSRREFAISGMCQACQDKVFDPNIQEY